MAQIVTVTSGKGGVGKSSICAGLGIQLSRLGRKTLLVDCDAGLRSLDLMLGIGERVVYDLGDVLDGRCSAADAVYAVPGHPGLFLIPAPAGAGTLEDGERLREGLRQYAGECDFLLLDAPAGIDGAFEATVSAAQTVLVVATGDAVCLRDAGKVAALCREAGCESVRLILNKLEFSLIKKGKFSNLDESIDEAGLQMLGVIPYDPALLLLSAGEPLARRSRAAKALERTARRLTGERVRLPKVKKI